MTATHRAHATLEALLEPIDGLKPYPGNARRGDVDVIARSLEVNGQYRPVVANRRNRQVLAGNHTLAAARQLGWTHVAVSWVDVDDEAAARIVLVDNRSNDVAGYDEAALAELLGTLPDLDGTGFTDADYAALLGDDEPSALTDVDDVPDAPAEPISGGGQVWQLGAHRLLVGDSTDVDAVTALLDGDQVGCVWTDPPYGVSYVSRGARAMTIANDGAGDMPELLSGMAATVSAVCRAGTPVYVAHADPFRSVLEQALAGVGISVRQNLIWVKHALVLGRADYHYRHEPVLEGEVAVTHESVAYGFTPDGEGRLGRGGPHWHGDDRSSTVFEVPRPARSVEHPTMKPVELVRQMIENSCPPGGLVLDLFGGSGSTLIAAHHRKARSALVELDPAYADVICRRWQEHTGVVPVDATSGEAVDFTART